MSSLGQLSAKGLLTARSTCFELCRTDNLPPFLRPQKLRMARVGYDRPVSSSRHRTRQVGGETRKGRGSGGTARAILGPDRADARCCGLGSKQRLTRGGPSILVS